MYLKFILRELFLLVMTLAGIFIFLIQYPFRKSIYNKPERWKTWRGLWLYWMSNSDESTFEDNWYGIYELVPNNDWQVFYKYSAIRKFFLSWHWVAFRNPHWNLTVLSVPKQGKKYDENKIINIGEQDIYTWRNYRYHGKQFVTWFVDGTQYFRYSFTREMKKSIFTKLTGFTHLNFMVGASNTRYLIKFRVFKYIPSKEKITGEQFIKALSFKQLLGFLFILIGTTLLVLSAPLFIYSLFIIYGFLLLALQQNDKDKTW